MSGTRELAAYLQTGSDSAGILVEALSLLADPAIPPADQATRAALLVASVRAALPLDDEAVSQLAGLPLPIRSGIASSLPPQAQRALYGTGCALPPNSGTPPSRGETVPDPPEPSPGEGRFQGVGRGTIVPLLSTEDNQEANARLLVADGFAAYRVASVDALEPYLESTDVAGFVVDGSFWRELDAAAQETLLSRLAQYSSIACLVIDASHFHDPARIRGVIQAQRPSDLRWFHSTIHEHSTLSSHHLDCLRLSSDLLSPEHELAFLPTDVEADELVAIVAACRAFFRDEYGRSKEQLQTLAWRCVPGGRSGARTLLVRFNNSGLPVLVKVSPREWALDEVARYELYFRRQDRVLRPSCYFHADVGVIVFGLIEDDATEFSPASSLDDEISGALQVEVWSDDRPALEARCAAIRDAVEKTCRELERLNREPADGALDTKAYLRGSSIRRLEASDVRWDIRGIPDANIAAALERIYPRTEPLRSRATVHGDVNLRNILVPRRGVPQLIDFACSGPGHPAYDLVRLEASLLFAYLRQLGSEEEFTRFQHGFSVDLMTDAELRAEFPIWWTSPLNSALIGAALLCRDGALRVLQAYGCGTADYLACKFVIGCWSLTVPGLQIGLIRATLGAIVDPAV